MAPTLHMNLNSIRNLKHKYPRTRRCIGLTGPHIHILLIASIFLFPSFCHFFLSYEESFRHKKFSVFPETRPCHFLPSTKT